MPRDSYFGHWCIERKEKIMKKRFKRGLAFLLATVMLIGCLGNGMSLKSYAAQTVAEDNGLNLGTASVTVTADTLQALVTEITTKNNAGGFTTTSWENAGMATAITNANSAISGGDEAAIAEAYEALKVAYCNLVPQAAVDNYALGKQPSAGWVHYTGDTLPYENLLASQDSGLGKATDGVYNNVNAYAIFGDDNVGEEAYMQIDLGQEIQIDNIHVWRYWGNSREHTSTAIVVSDKEDFSDVTTANVLYYSHPEVKNGGGTDIFEISSLNTDSSDAIVPFNILYNESSAGADLYQFVEGEAKVKARYVRIYGNGRTGNLGADNHIIELQVWGTPAELDLYNLTGLQELIDKANLLCTGGYAKEGIADLQLSIEKAEELVQTGVEEGSVIGPVQTLFWELEEKIDALVLNQVTIGGWPIASYTNEERAAYNEVFYHKPVNVTSNIGGYSGEGLENAWDDDLTSFWTGTGYGSNNNNGTDDSGKGTYVELQFEQTEEVGHMIYRVRQAAAITGRGFPTKFKIQVSPSETGDNFVDWAEGNHKVTEEYLKISFTPVECRRVRLVWEEVYSGYPSASVLYCYEEEHLAEDILELFMDGACTALKDTVSQDDLDALKEKIQNYPVPGNMSVYMEVAEMLMSGNDDTDRVHKPMVLSQMGNRVEELNRTGLTMSLSNWDLTGYYVRPGDVLDVFVDADTDGPMPRLVLAAIGRNYSWQYGYDGIALSNGHNRIAVPETMAGCQAIYFYNPALPDAQDYAPTVRLCGGNKYPVYFYDAKDSTETAEAKEAAFIEELTEYCPKIVNNLNKAALGEGEPNICEYVSDKVLISTTAKGALNAIDSEFTWNIGKYKEWAEENTTKHAVIERDEDNQVTGIRFAGPGAVMEAWEIMFEDMQLYCGFNTTDPTHEDYRNYGKFVFRAYTNGVGAGWGQQCYSGYNAGEVDMESPMDTGWFKSLVQSNAVLTGSWTEYHELGHLFDSGIIGVSESTNNLFGLSAQRKYLESTRMEDDNRWYVHFTNYINTGVLPTNDNLFYPGAVIIQLDGVDFSGKSIYPETNISNYGRACRYARLHKNELSHLSKNDKMVVSFSMACGVDLSSHFEFYGREVSAEAKMLLNGLPKEERPTYFVNDRTFKGGAFSTEDKEKAPVINSIESDENTGAVTIQMASDTFTEENLQCFAIYRQKMEDGELTGDVEWIGITGDNRETTDVNELYQFTDVNVSPGTAYQYSVSAYDCKLEENATKAVAEVTVGAEVEIPISSLIINNGDEGYTFNVGGTYKMQVFYAPANTTADLTQTQWWIEGYGRDEGKSGGGPNIITMAPDPDAPNDPTRKMIKGIQPGQTHVHVKVGNIEKDYRIVINGSLAVNDTDTTKYTFAFDNDRNTFKIGDTYGLNLLRTTCEADGTPTSEVVKVATTPSGVTWESSAPEVISVDNRGNITALQAGTATISFKRGAETAAQCELTVAAEAIALTGISFETPEITMEVGENLGLDYSLVPENATLTGTASVTSGNSSCVRVEKDGTITAVASGTTTVTVTIDGISADLTVTVNDYIPLKGLALSSEKVTLTGEGTTETLSVIKTPADATVSVQEAVWKSGNESVFTVQDGTLTAVGTGTAELTVSLEGKTATAQITVEGADIELTGIGFRGYNVNENITLNLVEGKTHQLALTIEPTDATALGNISWSSSDEKVAIVNYGYITAVSEGTTTITASLGQNEGTENEKRYQVNCNLTVKSADIPLEGIGISHKSVKLGGNENIQLSTYFIPTNANVDAEGNELEEMSWISADGSIASVDSTGMVTGKATGTTTITAIGNGFSVTCQVGVNDSNLVETISLDEESLVLDMRQVSEAQLSCTVLPETITAVPVWKSSDSSVVTVNQDGQLTLHKVGVAVITVTLGEMSDSCEVTVTGDTYTVTFESAGGTEVAAQEVTGGTKAEEPEQPKKENYIFAGWYAPNATNAFDFAKDVVTEDVTLTAKWQVEPPTANITSGSEVEKNTKVVLSSTAGNAIYYTLNGEEPTKASTRYEEPIVLTADTTLKAIAVEEGCVDSEVAIFTYIVGRLSITFDTDGGNENYESQKVKESETATKPTTDPTKDGYIFRGWYLVDTEGNIASTAYDFDTAVTEDITLKAKWEAVIVVPQIKGYTQFTSADLDTTKEYIIVSVDSDNKIYGLYANAKGVDFAPCDLATAGTYGLITAELKDVSSEPKATYLNTDEEIDFSKLHLTVEKGSNGYTFCADNQYYLAISDCLLKDTAVELSVAVTDGVYTIKNSNRILYLNVKGDNKSKFPNHFTDYCAPSINTAGNLKIYLLTKDTEDVEEIDTVVSISGELNKTYDGQAVTTSGLTATTQGTTGEVTYTFYADAQCKSEIAAPVNAGTYYVKGSARDANDADSMIESNVISFTINKAELIVKGATVTPEIVEETLTAKVTDVEFDGLATGESLALGTDYKVTAQYNNEKPNAVTGVTLTVELLNTETSSNYVLKNGEWTDDITLDKIEYTVIFKNGEETFTTKTVEFGETVTAPDLEPTKEGYNFVGWYASEEATESYDFTTAVKGNLTLTARWQEMNTVAAPTATPISGEVEEGTTVALSCETEGATIYFTLNGETPTENSTEYTTPIVITENTTVKAIAVKEGYKDSEVTTFTYTVKETLPEPVVTYTVSFNSMGGSDMTAQIVNAGEKASEPSAPRKEGYKFLGWYVTDDKGVTTEYVFETSVNANITLIAEWLDMGDIETDDWEEVEDVTEIPGKIWAAGIEDVTYNGAKHTFDLRVYDGNKMLAEGTDYTVSYKNNQNVYECSEENWDAYLEVIEQGTKAINEHKDKQAIKKFMSKAPQVILKMKGNYQKNQTIYFKIQPVSIAEGGDCVVEQLSAEYKANKKQDPKPVVSWKGKNLKNKKDYTFAVTDYPQTNTKEECKEAGIYTVTLTGKGNFTGERIVNYVIADSLTAMSKVKVDKIKPVAWEESFETEGAKPRVTVTFNKEPLTENTDYTVEYKENKAVGTALAVITAKEGSNYVGSKVVSFKINGTAMSKVKVEGIDKQNGYPYTGDEVTLPMESLKIYYKTGTAETDLNTEDYEVSYQKNVKKGTATLVLTGKEERGYTGTKKVSFKIVPRTLKAAEISVALKGREQTEGIWQVPFMKGGNKPEVVVMDGTTKLLLGTDYTVSYQKNKAVGDKALITIKGKGNYNESTTLDFTVVQKDVEVYKDAVVVKAADLVVKANKKYGWKQTFKVYDEDGKALSKKEADLANAVYTIQSFPEGVTEVEGFETGSVLNLNGAAEKTLTLPVGTEIQIKVELTGDNYQGEVVGTYRILESGHDISKAKIQLNPQDYTGKPILIEKDSQFNMDKTFVKNGNVILELHMEKYVDKDGAEQLPNMEVVPGSYVKNVNKGTAKVTLRGINGFGGEKTVTFKIVQRNVNDNWWNHIMNVFWN